MAACCCSRSAFSMCAVHTQQQQLQRQQLWLQAYSFGAKCSLLASVARLAVYKNICHRFQLVSSQWVPYRLCFECWAAGMQSISSKLLILHLLWKSDDMCVTISMHQLSFSPSSSNTAGILSPLLLCVVHAANHCSASHTTVGPGHSSSVHTAGCCA